MRFIAFIKKIPIWIKAITAAIAFIGLVYGGIMKYNSFIINRAEKARLERERVETEDVRWSTVFSFIRAQTSHNERQDSTSDIQSKRMLRMINTQINLKEYMMKNAPTKKDLQDIIDVFDYDKDRYEKFRSINGHNISIEPIK